MFHDLETLGSIHPIHNWEYADAAAREAASGFALTDLKKVALQLDSLSFWVLVDVGGGPSAWSPVGQTVGGFTSSTPADQLEAALHAQDGGATDAYAITLSPAIASYVTGTSYRFKANTANTGAATLNINGIGAEAIKKAAGGITTDLSSNDIRAGQWVEVVWDGTNFQMISLLGNAPSSSAPTTATTTSTGTQNDFNFSNADRLFVNAGSTLTLNGLVAGVDGQALDVLVKGAGACYLVNEAGGSTAANRILTRFQSPLIIATGGSARLIYDGTASRWVVTDWNSGVPTGPMNYTELKRNTDQTAPTATATWASFNVETSNAWGVFSSGSPTRLTIPTGQGGLWQFSIHWFLNQALTGQIQIGARVNGSTFVFSEDMYMSGSTAQKVSTWALNLAAGDYVEFYYYQPSGSDKTFQVQTFSCFRLS